MKKKMKSHAIRKDQPQLNFNFDISPAELQKIIQGELSIKASIDTTDYKDQATKPQRQDAVLFVASEKVIYSLRRASNDQDETIVKRKPNFLDHLISLCNIVPIMYREEVKGDLMAMREDLKTQGFSTAWVMCVLFGQWSMIMFYTYKIKLVEYLSPTLKREALKNTE